jgi:hypothetical protein
MNVQIKNVLLAIVIISLIGSCNKKQTNYDKIVQQELAKGQRFDSLFLGLYFGMKEKQFYDTCTEMNKMGLITEGTGGTKVLYKIKDALQYPVSMNFFPDFYQHKIYHMSVSYRYDAWAPWNKNLYADSLKTRLIAFYKKQYLGNNFITIKDKLNNDVYIKVDGNRRIIIGQLDEQFVNVDIADLLIEEKMKKEVKNK